MAFFKNPHPRIWFLLILERNLYVRQTLISHHQDQTFSLGTCPELDLHVDIDIIFTKLHLLYVD